ncbi:MAG: N-acetylmuramoyl-L-alanine amidase [Pseudomonadota bacterium]
MSVFIRRASLFLSPLIILLVLLFIFDRWFDIHKDLKTKPAATTAAKNKTTEEYVIREKKPFTVENRISAQTHKLKQDSFTTLMLDPAHGGDDIGNIGYKSAVESNINLQFSFKLARALRMRGMKVYLTRMDDKTVPLEQRLSNIKSKNIALYVSINCAYSDIRTIKGMEIYGFTPAQSDDDETEKNANKFYDIYEGKYFPKTPESMVVENKVSRALKDELELPYKSRLERKFLKPIALPADVPSLFIYVGYISNEEDTRLLSNEKYIDKITERIATAVEKALTKNG